MKTKIFLIVASVLLMNGCVITQGNPNVANTKLINEKIKIGKTKKIQVDSLFGNPSYEPISDTWTYSYSSVDNLTGGSGFYNLYVKYNTRNIVKKFTTTKKEDGYMSKELIKKLKWK